MMMMLCSKHMYNIQGTVTTLKTFYYTQVEVE